MGYQPTGLIRLLYYLQSLLSFLIVLFKYRLVKIQIIRTKRQAGWTWDLRAVNYGQGWALLAHENIAPILQLDLHPTLFMGFCYVSHSEATPSLIIWLEDHSSIALTHSSPPSNSIYRFSFDLNFCSSVDTNFDRLLIN